MTGAIRPAALTPPFIGYVSRMMTSDAPLVEAALAAQAVIDAAATERAG